MQAGIALTASAGTTPYGSRLAYSTQSDGQLQSLAGVYAGSVTVWDTLHQTQ